VTHQSGDDFIYRSQDVDYLGFLEAQLRDLQGGATLAYELIQNADDVGAGDGAAHGEAGADDGGAASRLTFDVTDEALMIENDGRFREVDFGRMQRIASGDKREERDTTGAFGLGFIAVYQVTDAPEIFSSGRHWRIRPEASAQQRIEERSAAVEGTRFRLPWAFDEASPVRRALRLAAVRLEELDELAGELAEAIGRAALFLRRLRLLEVRRSGRLLRSVERLPGPDDRLVLVDEKGHKSAWLVLSGDFGPAAAALRDHYPWQIEAARHDTVRLALPLPETPGPFQPDAGAAPIRGRLYATLPTAFSLPLPFHVDADFFPTVDRKSIHFDGGYQAGWNQAAVAAAAGLLADNLTRLPEALGPVRLWQLIEQVAAAHQESTQGELPAVFGAFWQALAPRLAEEAVVFTAAGRWQVPATVYRMPLRSEREAAGLLAAIGLDVPQPDLAAFTHLLARPEIGVPELAVADIAQALMAAGLSRSTPLARAPSALREFTSWQTLWQLLDTLLSRPMRPTERDEYLARLGPCAVALSQQMTLERLAGLFRGPAETRALFPEVKWLHDSLPADAFPGRYVAAFGVRQAVEWLAEQPVERLEEAWRLGRLDPAAIYRWFEERPIEIFGDDPALQREIRRLPLVPVDGRLRPLAGLFLPGGFEDPLGLAGAVDPEAIGGRRQFLADLGLAELDFEAYVHGPMQQALRDHPELPSDARHRLAALLAGRLGELRDDAELQEQLSRLPLVPCLDGSFRPGSEVFSAREAIALLGDRVHIAEPAESQALQALYRWLGVRDRPVGVDLVAALLATAREPEPDRERVTAAGRCWRRLAELLAEGEMAAAELAPLREQPTFPDPAGRLLRPEALLINDRPELAAGFGDLGPLAGYLLSADDPLALVARAAGARRLSEVAEQEVIVPAGAAPDAGLGERIAGRRELLARLLRGEGEAGPAERLAFLERLQVVMAGQVAVRYRLEAGGRELLTNPQPAAAVLDRAAMVLYVAAGDEGVPWAAVARALAEMIRPERPAGALASGIKEVLAAGGAAGAALALDELGYP
jgi:hypothetical protein